MWFSVITNYCATLHKILLLYMHFPYIHTDTAGTCLTTLRSKKHVNVKVVYYTRVCCHSHTLSLNSPSFVRPLKATFVHRPHTFKHNTACIFIINRGTLFQLCAHICR